MERYTGLMIGRLNMFGKGAKSVKERKDSLSTNGAGPTDYPQAIYPCAKLHTL